MKIESVFKKVFAVAAITFVFFLSSCTKEQFTSGEQQEFSLTSVANGGIYNIKVGLPAGYNPTQKYATVYVLDGEEIFGFVANQAREISERLSVQNVIVVSIGYGRDRSIDYTPTKLSSITGGAAAFLSFIQTQLIPRIEKDYSVDTTRAGRVILGHSYGGLFGGYAFSVNNAVFGNYIMLSPSFWFDNLVTLQMEMDNRPMNQLKKQLVFMGIGEAENSGRMQAPFVAFYEALQDNYPNMKLGKAVAKNLDHVGSRAPNIIEGLTYYFQNR